MTGGCSGKTAEQEDVGGARRRRRRTAGEAEEQEQRQRVLAAEAGDLAAWSTVFSSTSARLQIEPLDDLAHAERLFLAQALAAPVGLGVQPGALLARSSSRSGATDFIRFFNGCRESDGISV